MIHDLRGAMERTGAEIGIFLTLTPPKGGMAAEATPTGGGRISASVTPALRQRALSRSRVPHHSPSDRSIERAWICCMISPSAA